MYVHTRPHASSQSSVVVCRRQCIQCTCAFTLIQFQIHITRNRDVTLPYVSCLSENSAKILRNYPGSFQNYLSFRD